MSVLVLQLAGPLQSWGSSARFVRRTTEQAPTKSGVIGLLAAALGRERTDDLADLAGLRFGVRIDQRGTPLRDFQTAHHFETDRAFPVSERFYLADAVFIAALEGERAWIERLHQAVEDPVFLPYLGRRSCPPTRPIGLRVVHDRGLEEVLEQEPWQAATWYQERHREPAVTLEARMDAEAGDRAAESLRDHPVSFDPRHRRYELRNVRTWPVTVTNPKAPTHDPTPLLGGA